MPKSFSEDFKEGYKQGSIYILKALKETAVEEGEKFVVLAVDHMDKLIDMVERGEFKL